MNLDERVKEKNSRINRVKISAIVSEEINNLLEEAVSGCDHATKELLIEIAVEDFLEKYQMPVKEVTISNSLFISKE